MPTPSVLLLLLASAAADGSPPATGTEAAAAPPVAATTLAEVRGHPTRWLGEEVSFVLQFDEPRDLRDVYWSRFGSHTHWAFRAWGGEQALWERADYDDPAPRLFTRLGSAAELRLRAARRYERFEVVGRVAEVFLGEPWIEVERVRRLDTAWNEGALVHATRAQVLMASGRWYLAADQFERALAARLPRADAERLTGLRDGCRERHYRAEARRKRGLSALDAGR